jgi:hypothetical protein
LHGPESVLSSCMASATASLSPSVPEQFTARPKVPATWNASA